MGSGFSKMKKQAREMQEQIMKAQKELSAIEVEGQAGGSRVKLMLNGDKNLKSITIDPECVDPSDVEGLQDLILEAFKDASQKLAEKSPKADLANLGNMGNLPFGF